jgi:hypothetical protein
MGVFEDIAQEVMAVCHDSLIHAKNSIAKQMTRLDANLFYLKHLAYLRHELQSAFPLVEFSRSEPLLGLESVVLNVLNTIVIERKFDFNILSEFGKDIGKELNQPSVTDQLTNARHAIDIAFKKVCEDLLLEVSSACLEPITTFNLKVFL